MWSGFTAVFIQHDNGVVTAYVAEISGISIGANSLEEARATLTEQLRARLEFDRDDALARFGSIARFENMEPWKDRCNAARPTGDVLGTESKISSSLTANGDFKKHLYRRGIISEMKPALRQDAAAPDREPVPIAGRPISEEIIEDRR